jgi:hypothetical protein
MASTPINTITTEITMANTGLLMNLLNIGYAISYFGYTRPTAVMLSLSKHLSRIVELARRGGRDASLRSA